MKPFQLLTFVSTVLTVLTISASADTKNWCGKPYTPRTPKATRSLIPRELLTESWWKRATSANATSNDQATITLPVTTSPIPQVPNLSKGYAAMVRIQPYLSTDNQGSLVINVVNGTGSVSVQASLVDNGNEVLPKTSVNVKDMAVEVPFSISNIPPKTTPYTLKVQLADNVIYAKLYRLPSGPKTVKIDRLTGATITSTGNPIFPVGPYVDFGWLGQGDIAANLKTLKGLGYNVINPDPTYTDLSLVDKLFQAADALGGIYIQLSFRYSFTQTAQVVQQVNRFKTYSSLLTWYTADEPDGEQWTDSSAELTVYNAIKAADPYHPVALVLNCQNTGAFYADTTDILGTDVYPVGVDMSHCTDTNDVCGCDDCLGSATLDIPKRTTRYMQDLTLIGRQSINQWMVLQAFSDPTTWWSKMPTPAEFRVMSYISIINGYKSIMFWKYPFTPNDSLKAQITQISGETQTLSQYILQMQQLPPTHFTTTTKNLYYSGWMSADSKSFMAIVVNGDPSNSVQYSVTVQDLTTNGKLSGTGNTDSGGKQSATMNNGVLTGSLKAYEVGWFTFGVTPPKLSANTTFASNASAPSGTNSDGTTNSTGSAKSTATKISLGSNIVFLVGALVAGLFALA